MRKKRLGGSSRCIDVSLKFRVRRGWHGGLYSIVVKAISRDALLLD
jgi:hypothetical protein